MNAPTAARFLTRPAGPQQPMVSGTCWRTVEYDGLWLDVYRDADGDMSGVAAMGNKINLCAALAAVIDEIEAMANKQLVSA